MTYEASLSPVLGYRDADAAAQWLCRAFGFQQCHVESEPDGVTRFISLRLGAASIIVSPAADLEPANLFRQPDQVNGANTQSCYLAVRDADAHAERALLAGARIEFEPQDDYAGNRFYMCRDIEGHLWTFGTGSYGALVEPDPVVESTPPRLTLRNAVAVAAVSLLAGSIAAYGSFTYLPVVSAIKQAPASGNVHREIAKALVPQPILFTQPVFSDLVAADTMTALVKEQATVADLRETTRDLNAQLWRLGSERSKADAALQISNAQLRQLSNLYDQAKQQAELARQAAAAAEADKARVAASLESQKLASLEGQKSAATNSAAAIGEIQLAKSQAEQSVAETKAVLGTQRTLMNKYRLDLEAANHQLGDLLESRLLLQQRMDQMTAALASLQTQKSEAEQTASLYKEQLARQIDLSQSEHTELLGAQTALLSAQKQIDDLQLSAKPSLPTAAGKLNVSVSIGRVAPQAKVTKPVAVQAMAQPPAVAIDTNQPPAMTADAPQAGGPSSGSEYSKCLGTLFGGKVDWGGGRNWKRTSAVSLCKGTRASGDTIDCFTKQVNAGVPWPDAIVQCRKG